MQVYLPRRPRGPLDSRSDMSPPSSEIIHATQHRPSPSASLGALEMGKSSSEHVEHVAEVDIGQDVIYHGGDDATKPRTGLRKLLRRNPSLEFIREVAIENTKELDPVEVAKVEKKLFWLIVPALAVDYAFYYVSLDSWHELMTRSTRRHCRTLQSLVSKRSCTSAGRDTQTSRQSFT